MSRVIYGGRVVYIAAAWLLVIGIVLTVFMAGMSLFADGSFWNLHKAFAYNTGWSVPILIILGVLARPPRRHVGLLALLLGLIVVQSLLPLLRGVLPPVAALHPVNAMLVFGATVVHARRARMLLQPSPAPGVRVGATLGA